MNPRELSIDRYTALSALDASAGEPVPALADGVDRVALILPERPISGEARAQ